MTKALMPYLAYFILFTFYFQKFAHFARENKNKKNKNKKRGRLTSCMASLNSGSLVMNFGNSHRAKAPFFFSRRTEPIRKERFQVVMRPG